VKEFDFSVKIEGSRLGACDLSPSLHLFVRTNTRTKLRNLSFADPNLKPKLLKNTLKMKDKFFNWSS
jgi:hypothetical protein